MENNEQKNTTETSESMKSDKLSFPILLSKLKRFNCLD